MEKETFSFIFQNLDKLEGVDFFLITLIALVISAFIFLVFKWLYNGLLSNQKELIETKDKLTSHYREQYEELKATIDKQSSTPNKLKVGSNELGDNSGMYSREGHLYFYGANVKLQSCFYMLNVINLLKNGLWSVILKSQSEELVLETQYHIKNLDYTAKTLQTYCFNIGESIDVKKHEDWNVQRVALDKASMVSLANTKQVLKDTEDFIDRHLDKQNS